MIIHVLTLILGSSTEWESLGGFNPTLLPSAEGAGGHGSHVRGAWQTANYEAVCTEQVVLQ